MFDKIDPPSQPCPGEPEPLDHDTRQAWDGFQALDSDQQAAIRRLKDLDFGFLPLMGFPGSDKTSLTMFLLLLLLGRDMSTATEERFITEPVPEPESTLEDDVDSSPLSPPSPFEPFPISTISDDSEKIDRPTSPEPNPFAMFMGEEVTPLTDLESGAIRQVPPLPAPSVSSKEWLLMSEQDKLNAWNASEGDRWESPRSRAEVTSVPSFRRPRAIFIGTVNTQLDRLCKRFQAQANEGKKDLTLLRLNTPMRETKTFDSKDDKRPELFEGGDFAGYMEYSRDLSRISTEAHSSGRLGPKTHGADFSLASQTWQQIDSLKDRNWKYGYIADVHGFDVSHPHFHRPEGRKYYNQFLFEAMVDVIRDVDMVFATPVAFAKLCDKLEAASIKMDWDIVVVHEAARILEPLHLVAISRCKSAVLHIMNGDTK